MTKEMILEVIAGIIRQLFDDESICITPDTSAADIDGWDSFEHINILVAIESEFDVRFDMDQVYSAKNVGELVELVFAAKQ